MITAIHHVQITIPPRAEDEARAFYCGLLGLREIEKPASLVGRGGFWLAVGDRSVHVGTEERTAAPDSGGPAGSLSKAHVAYQVTDLDHLRRRLRDAGFEVIEGIPIPGYERFESRDPFGNRIELIMPLPPRHDAR